MAGHAPRAPRSPRPPAPDLPTEALELIASHLLPARLRNLEDATAASENAVAMLGVCRAWRAVLPAVRERFAALAQTLEPALLSRGKKNDPAEGLLQPAWLPPSLEAPLNYQYCLGITEFDARHYYWLSDADLRPLERYARARPGPLGAVWLYAAGDVKAAWRRKSKGVRVTRECVRDRWRMWDDRREAAESAGEEGEWRRSNALEAELGTRIHGLCDFPPVARWLQRGHGSAAAAADAVRVYRFIKRLPEYRARADQVSESRSWQCARDLEIYDRVGPRGREVEACTVAALWAYVARCGGLAAVEADAGVPEEVKAAACELGRRERDGELLHEYRPWHDMSGEEEAREEEHFSVSWWETHVEMERERQRERDLYISESEDKSIRPPFLY